MMASTLYVDEDASERAVVEGLRARGLDVLTTLEAGNLGNDDETQLDFSALAGRVLYTCNICDYARIHRDWMTAGRAHAGIVVIPKQRYRIGEKIRLPAFLLSQKSDKDMRNQIHFL